MLPAEPVKRLNLSQIFTDDHRVGGEHGIVAAGGDRHAQGGQLATRLAGVGVHGRHRPAQILDQADHHAALIGQAGVVSLSSGSLPDVCSGGGQEHRLRDQLPGQAAMRGHWHEQTITSTSVNGWKTFTWSGGAMILAGLRSWDAR